jgi:uncharacterized protein (TIGR03437 family)
MEKSIASGAGRHPPKQSNDGSSRQSTHSIMTGLTMPLTIKHLLPALAATSLLAQPSIKPGGIVNASSSQPTLAPGVVFVIYGANMGPAAIVSAPAPSYPASLSGTSVTFAPQPAGATVTAKMVYTLAGQIAGFLPSSTAPGIYAVSVTYNNQSSPPQTVTVVPRSLGIATANSAGNGIAQATIGNVNGGLSLTRFTSGSAAIPGPSRQLIPATLSSCGEQAAEPIQPTIRVVPRETRPPPENSASISAVRPSRRYMPGRLLAIQDYGRSTLLFLPALRRIASPAHRSVPGASSATP